MEQLILMTSLIVAFLGLSVAQCPQPWELPDQVGDRTFCSRVYEHSHSQEDKSCRGKSLSLYHGDKVYRLGSVFNDKISSVVVQYGCRLIVWEHSHHQGHKHAFWAGVHTSLNSVRRGFWAWHNWNDVISSYECVCQHGIIPAIRRSRVH